MSISGVQHDFGGRGGRRKAKYLLFLQYIPCSEKAEEKQKKILFSTHQMIMDTHCKLILS
jgi:hypothetical protein